MQPPSQDTAKEPQAADDLTNIDLYCLHCGYNLRGLSGNPRRCPECGGMNPIGESLVTSELVAREQGFVDTLPVSCLRTGGLSLLGPISVLPFLWFNGDLLDPPPCTLFCGAGLLLVCAPLWVRRITQFGESCRYRRGGRSWLVHYHLISLLLAVLVIGFAFLLVQPQALVGWRWTMHPWRLGVFYVIIIACFVLGVAGYQKSYRRLFAKRLQLQEGVALERARARLRQSVAQGRSWPRL